MKSKRTSKGVAALSAQLEWLWANCKIVYWPPSGYYPIEHDPHARKYARDAIEAKMPNEKAETLDGKPVSRK